MNFYGPYWNRTGKKVHYIRNFGNSCITNIRYYSQQQIFEYNFLKKKRMKNGDFTFYHLSMSNFMSKFWKIHYIGKLVTNYQPKIGSLTSTAEQALMHREWLTGLSYMTFFLRGLKVENPQTIHKQIRCVN